jgi:hypothetical protein
MSHQSHLITLLMPEKKSSNHVPHHLALSTLFYTPSMNGKLVIHELERPRKKWSWRNRRTIQAFIWPEKQQNISHRTDGLRTEIRKRHHTNIFQEYYHTNRTKLYSLCAKTTLRNAETVELNSTCT